ncbi:MAG: putative repeat protein (TIGR01451 family) [Paraglaciecola sp.]|jgi:uncharacterized repeat protein (TIGR01451 family)
MKKQKHVFIVILSLFFLSSVFGQGWERTFGSFGDDQGRSVIQTSDGGFVLTGKLGNETAVIKTNSLGFMEWEQVYESAIGNDIQQMDDGGFIMVGGAANEPFLYKLDELGNLESELDLSTTQLSSANKVRRTPDNQFIIVGSSSGATSTPNGVVVKMDVQGNILWEIILGLTDINTLYSVETTSDGGYIISGADQNLNFAYAMYIAKLDGDGNVEWEKAFNSGYIGWGNTVAQTPDGGYILVGSEKVGFPPNFSDNIRLIKISATGDTEWDKNYGEDDIISEVAMGVQVAFDGGFVVTGFAGNDAFLMKTDNTGEVIWEKRYGNVEGDNGVYLQRLNDGYVFVGTTAEVGNPTSDDILLVRTDTSGVGFSNFITGNVWFDETENCELDAAEIPLEDWIVQALGTDLTFSRATDEMGYYSIPADLGEYTVVVTPPVIYWNPCENELPVNLVEYGDSAAIDFPTQALIDCPLLTIDISTPFLRRCFENTYSVNYCNQGTIPAEDAYIEIIFDEFLDVISSTQSWVSQVDSLYVFEVGDLAIGDCGSFQIVTSVNCDETVLGQTHCTSAHIFPDTICIPSSSLWDESDIIVNGYCEGDSLYFEIENIGTGNTAAPLQYIIIEDHIILLQQDYLLPSGDKKEIVLPANGAAFRLETEQSVGHPIGNMPAVTIEGCIDGDDFSVGFTNLFPDGDDAPFISIDCQENIGSYDPNDKQAFPTGYGDEHFIEANIDLEYLIRFQNTGTDTAFTVVVEDVISSFFNLNTIVPGASSHAYDFQIINERTVRFVFDNILLPDSTTNLLGSIGFIKFKIKQELDNPIGTMIENTAGIYFDFNEPIITNTVFHEIGKDFIESNVIIATEEIQIDDVKVTIFPNPFNEYTNFKVENTEFQELEFQLYQADGKLVRREFYDNSTFRFERNGLLSGMYFYQLSSNGTRIYSGRMMMK